MFKLVVGCYEQFVIGYTVNVSQENDKLLFKSEKQFSDHTHLGCVKSVASNNIFVVSCSTDETINIFDMKANTDYGPMQGHTGSVNQVLMPEGDGSRVVSCGDDGTVCVWVIAKKKTGLLKSLRGHKAAVSSVAVHPSGKLAMSVSVKDGTLRTWNMVTGRVCYIKNLKQLNIEFVRWSSSGNYYVLASNHSMQIFELSNAKCIHELKSSHLIVTIKSLPLIHSSSNDEYIVAGDTSGFISIYSLLTGSLITRFKAHDNRVKDLHGFVPSFLTNPPDDEVWLASVSSDEKIKVWKIDNTLLLEKNSEVPAECLLELHSSARLTCVTVWQSSNDENEHEEEKKAEESVQMLEENEKREVSEVLKMIKNEKIPELGTSPVKKSKKKKSASKGSGDLSISTNVIRKVGKRKVSFDPQQVKDDIKSTNKSFEKRKRKKKISKLL